MQVMVGQAGAEPAQKERELQKRGDGGYGMREGAWKRKKSEGRRGLAFFSGEKPCRNFQNKALKLWLLYTSSCSCKLVAGGRD